MNITDLKYFKAIADCGGLRKASERLHISQPALTHAMKRLEADLEVTLFIRTKKGMQLTAEGKNLLFRAHIILESVERLRVDLKSSDQEMRGKITLGCHPSVAKYTLNHFMYPFLEKNKGVQFQLIHDLSRNIFQKIIEGEVQFGFVVNPQPSPDLIIKEIGTDTVQLWKSPQSNKNILIYDPQLSQSQWILQKLEKNKIYFSQKIESNNLEVISYLVQKGMGIGILPSRVAETCHNLNSFGAQYPTFKDRICFVYRPTIRSSHVLRQFADFVQEMKKTF